MLICIITNLGTKNAAPLGNPRQDPRNLSFQAKKSTTQRRLINPLKKGGAHTQQHSS